MNRWFCLFVSIILLVFSCKGTPGAKDDDLDRSISEPVPGETELVSENSEIEDSDSVPDNLADQELPEENAEAELAIEDNEEPEPESAELAAAPLEPQPSEPSHLEPAYTPIEVPTAPTTPPVVTAVSEPAVPETTIADSGESVEELPSTTEATDEETPAITRWPPPRPPELEPPVLRPQILPDEEPVFSRTVRVTVGQLLEIPFRGTGWVYLGEMNFRKGITYGSRRVEPEGQNFVFKVEAPGTYALKFYKEDFIRDIIFNDYVQVIAEENPEASNAPWLNPPFGDRNKVVAEPRWPSTLEEAEIARTGGRRTTSSPEVSAIPGGGTRSSTSGTASSGTAGTPPASGTPLTSGTSSPAASNIDRATPSTSGSTRTPPANTTNGARPPANSTTATPPTNTTPGGIPPAPPVSPALPTVTDEGVSPVKPPAISGGTDNGLEKSDKDWPPEVFLQRAQEEFDAGRISEAIALLNRMRELYPLGNDELYWLLGQFYEANSPSRDILLSLDYYRRLINEFPQSRRYNDARRRIAYLERYYINIQ